MIKKRIIESVSKKSKRFSPSKIFRENAHIKSFEEYLKLYQESIENPDLFWAKQAEELDWFKKWDKVSSWKKTKLECKWFEGGKINISYNCLDRHLDSRGNKTALIWEPEVGKAKKYTYKEGMSYIIKSGVEHRIFNLDEEPRLTLCVTPEVNDHVVKMVA